MISTVYSNHSRLAVHSYNNPHVVDMFLLCVACLLLFLFLLVVWCQLDCWRLVWAINGWRGLIQQPMLWLCLVLCLEPQHVLERITRLRQYFTRPLVIIIGTRCLLYVDDPHTLEQIFNAPQCVDKTFLQNGFFAHNGLLHAKGEKWKNRRKQLNPCFSQSILHSFFDVFNSVGSQLQANFAQQLQGDKVPFKAVEELLSKAVLEVSCRTTMGCEMTFMEENTAGIAHIHKQLLKISAMKIVKPWLQCDAIFRLCAPSLYRIGENCNKLVKEFVQNIIVRKYSEWKMQTVKMAASANNCQHNIDVIPATDSATEELQNAMKQKRIFIEQIFHLAAVGELTLQQIMDESQSMVLVSFETVSNNIVITLLLLAMHTSVQGKLRMEINEIMAKETEVTAYHLQQMQYLDAVVNEALRLLTTVPLNMRYVSEKLLLTRANTNKSKEAWLPKGSLVLLDIFNMQRDPSHWGNRAEKFDPEHHFMARHESRHAYAFSPFSKGIRTCIGWRYSILLTKIFLVKLIKVLEFGTDSKLEQLRYVEGISLKFQGSEHIKFYIQHLHYKDDLSTSSSSSAH